MTHENSPVNMNHYIPNTSSIPNILFDYWMLHLTPAEFKVLMCIARKTYGWRKDFDRISITQIEKMTGLSRKGITKNLDALIEHGLITKIKSKTSDGDDAPNQYEVNVHCLRGGSELSTPPVVNSVHQGVVYSVHPQKKTYTKENIQYNSPPIPPHSPEPSLPAKAGEKRKKFSSDFSEEIKQLADAVIGAIVATKPDFAVPVNKTPLMTSLDLMIRIDKRDPQKILDVLRWALADKFWRDKMMKPDVAKYLREKFDQLDEKMKFIPEKPTGKVDRRTKNMDGTPVDAPHIDRLF